MSEPASQKKMGRPPTENPASEKLPMVRVTPAQLSRYKAAAAQVGQSFSAWVRNALDKASS